MPFDARRRMLMPAFQKISWLWLRARLATQGTRAGDVTRRSCLEGFLSCEDVRAQGSIPVKM